MIKKIELRAKSPWGRFEFFNCLAIAYQWCRIKSRRCALLFLFPFARNFPSRCQDADAKCQDKRGRCQSALGTSHFSICVNETEQMGSKYLDAKFQKAMVRFQSERESSRVMKCHFAAERRDLNLHH